MAFPTDIPSLNDPTASNKLSNPSHSQLHQDVNTNLEAGLTKLGTGATTPTTGAVLVGDGAGTSAWDTSPANITLDTPTLNTPDLNGTELILDADADTSITADTDDQIDIKLAGSDDFRFTANTFTALSGSAIATNTIAETTAASGVTIDGVLLKDNKMNGSYITDSTVSNTQLATGVAVQLASTNYSAVATGTTTIPKDDTIPQITEGTEFMTQTITPISATNILVIEICIYLSLSIVDFAAAALFQDSTANALAVGDTYFDTAGSAIVLNYKHRMVAGTTSATTFRVRAGGGNASTITFNGVSGVRRFGATTKSSIVITEYKAA